MTARLVPAADLRFSTYQTLFGALRAEPTVARDYVDLFGQRCFAPVCARNGQILRFVPANASATIAPLGLGQRIRGSICGGLND